MLLLLLSADAPVDLELNLHGEQTDLPTLLDVSSFLYDFNLVYELGRLATDQKYRTVRFSRYSLFRKGRPLDHLDRLSVTKLSQSSPLYLQTLLWGAPLAVGALWGIVQIVEKVSNWRLNRDKLEEELKKLQRENLAAETAAKTAPIYSEEEYIIQMKERETWPLIDEIGRRLEISPVKIKELKIRFVRRIRRHHKK